MNMFPVASIALSVALLLAAHPVSALADGAGGDVRIAVPTQYTATTVDVPGDLVVASGATLDVRGATLRIGGTLHVEEGATLLMGPHEGVPARLLALGAPGFGILVDGHAESGGEPRTIIRGLGGNGLDTVVGAAPGGLRVNGTADLRDLDVRNGTAGLIAAPGGVLNVTDAHVEYLYLMGVASFGGTVNLERVRVVENIIGVTGRGPGCSITVRDSHLDNWAANFQMTSCDLNAEGTRFEGSDNNVFQGRASIRLADSSVTGYRLTGLKADGGPAALVLEDVVVDGGGVGERGIRLGGSNQMQLRNVTVRGNTADGVLSPTGALDMDRVRLHSNGGFGLALVNVRPPVGLTDAVDFGSPGGGTSNGAGALSSVSNFPFTLLDRDGNPVADPFVVRVYGPGATQARHEAASTGPGQAYVSIEAYDTNEGGRPVFAGPFTYEVESTLLDGPQRGEVVLYSESVVLRMEDAPGSGLGWPSLLLMGLAGVLLVVGLTRRDGAGKPAGAASSPAVDGSEEE